MLDYFKQLATSIIGVLCDLLPTDALQAWLGNVAMETGAIITGLKWLNWFVDIEGMELVMNMWLLGVGAYYVWRYGLNIFNAFSNYLQPFAGLPDDE